MIHHRQFSSIPFFDTASLIGQDFTKKARLEGHQVLSNPPVSALPALRSKGTPSCLAFLKCRLGGCNSSPCAGWLVMK